MNYYSLIWGTASTAIPSLYILFTLYFIGDICRSFLNETR